MLETCHLSGEEARKVSWLYSHSGIQTRYSVFPDYSLPAPERRFYPMLEDAAVFPSVERRMEWYETYATPLAVRAIKDCLQNIAGNEVTHLITVSCTGMSAPGLDISLMREMRLPADLDRTSVNFMGCYGVLHALKMADHICRCDPMAMALIVSVELCTLHFQYACSMDNLTSGLLFGDGSAAALVAGDGVSEKGVRISGFFSQVDVQGEKDMGWNLSQSGFLMRLSPAVPALIGSEIERLLCRCMTKLCLCPEDIGSWAFHPGGKKILEEIGDALHLEQDALRHSYEVLRKYGNMSSATILFVLHEIMQGQQGREAAHIFMAAFGPGLTFETAILER
jgi:predicted naringenin-chalcone synthase